MKRLVLLAAVAALVAVSGIGPASAQPAPGTPFCDEAPTPPPFSDGADRDCMHCTPNVPCAARTGSFVLYCVERDGREYWCNEEYAKQRTHPSERDVPAGPSVPSPGEKPAR